VHETRSVNVTPGDTDREDLKSTTYEFFILAISVMSILNMALLFVLPFESQSWWLVAIIDAVLTIIFLVDFTYRLATAPTKRWYLRHGGVFDLLGCIPGLRIFRLFRIVRAVRIVRRLGGPRVFGELRAGLASGTLYLVVFLGLLTLEVTGLLELRFEENAPGANSTTAGDALWWGCHGHDRRLRRPVSRDDGRANRRNRDAHRRRGLVRDLLGLPRQLVPLGQPGSAGAQRGRLRIRPAATLQHVERLHLEQQAALGQLRAQIALDNTS
jgi:ion transport protein